MSNEGNLFADPRIRWGATLFAGGAWILVALVFLDGILRIALAGVGVLIGLFSYWVTGKSAQSGEDPDGAA